MEDVFHLLMECIRFQAESDKLIKELRLIKHNIGVFHEILSAPLSDAAKKMFSFVSLHFVK